MTSGRGKDAKSKVEAGVLSSSQMANKFLSYFPWPIYGVHILCFPTRAPPTTTTPPLRKRLTFVWSLWEVGIRSGTMGLPTVRGWEEPSQISQPEDWLIRPLSLPSHRPHINTFAPHCPPPSCSGICSPQQPVLSTAVRAEVSHWQFAPNRFVRASYCTTPHLTSPTCLFQGLGSRPCFFFFFQRHSVLRRWCVCMPMCVCVAFTRLCVCTYGDRSMIQRQQYNI